MKEQKICKGCNTPFIPTVNRQLYCSKECRVKANSKNAKLQKYEHNCLNCNNIIIGKENKNARFCCKECELEYQIKEKEYYLENEINDDFKNENEIKNILKDLLYLKILKIINKSHDIGELDLNNKLIDYRNLSDIPKNTREFVLNRDNHKCQLCNSKYNLHIHHIIKRKDGGNHEPENLITLCASCHRHIEIGDIDKALKGCLINAQKNYDVYHQEQSITIGQIYNDLINVVKIINNGDIQEATYLLNTLLDEIEYEYEWYTFTAWAIGINISNILAKN